jgi:hypothetical protein
MKRFSGLLCCLCVCALNLCNATKHQGAGICGSSRLGKNAFLETKMLVMERAYIGSDSV